MQLSLYDPVLHFTSGVYRRNIQAKRQFPTEDRPDENVVVGRDRFKFFQRPVKPQQFPPLSSRLTTDRYGGLQHLAELIKLSEQEYTELCTRGTQTDYRESEAQTDPWDPPYYVHTGSPEILTINNFHYGYGLPAGESEIELIERARAKKEWEASLPPVSSDQRQFKKRQMMIAEKEKEEWAYKGKKVEKLQNQQLEFLELTIIEARKQQEQENIEHLEWLWARKKAQTDRQLKKYKSKYSRELQKINKKHQIPSKKPLSGGKKRELYSSASDSVLARRDTDLTRKSKVPYSKYLATASGLTELEGWLQETANFAMSAEIYLPKRPPRPTRYQKLLQQTHQDILESKSTDAADAAPIRQFKLERPKLRPPTPSAPPVPDLIWDRERASIILQRVLRGRARQKQMLDGRARKKDLIDELHSTHPIYQAEAPDKEQQKLDTLAAYEERKVEKDKETSIDEALAEMEGPAISSVMNFLSKEMRRLEEERKVKGLMKLAEHERRVREAEEAGTRQKEERRQVMENEIFIQVHELRQSTADSYIGTIMSEVVETPTTSTERRKVSLESEEIVSELMYGYLLPEVERQVLREKNNQHQQKYRAAARELIYVCKSVEGQIETTDTQGVETSSKDTALVESSSEPQLISHTDSDSNIGESGYAPEVTETTSDEHIGESGYAPEVTETTSPDEQHISSQDEPSARDIE